MGIDYTTDGIIDSIKLKGIFPDAQQLYLPNDLISLMNSEMRSIVIPQIMSVKQEYFVASYDQDIAAGQSSFFIPSRAVGVKLRDCVLVDSGGAEIPLHRYEPEDVKNGAKNCVTNGFIVDNDQVVLVPSNQDFSTYTLRMKIFRRPNNLVQRSSAALISSIDTGTLEVTCSNMPTTFTTSMTYDFIKGKPSFRAHAEEQAVSVKTGFTLKFVAALPEDLAVGDWIAETGFSPIPQIPYELHPLIEQRVIIKCLEGMKDKSGMELAKASYEEMIEKFGLLVSPRVDGTPQKIVSRRGVAAFNRSSGVSW